MKLDYDSLKAIKPDIILTTATAFGGPGPWSDRVGFDGVGQVMSGAVYMTGTGDPPYRAAVNWVDFGTALHCAFGTLAALDGARRSPGAARSSRARCWRPRCPSPTRRLIEQAVIAANRVPTGNLGQTAAPVDIYRTKDGWVLCQVTGQPLFIRWAKLMGEEQLADRSALCRRSQARRERRRDQRADGALVCRAHLAGGARYRSAQAMHSGRPGAEPAAGAGPSAHSRRRFPAGRRLSRSCRSPRRSSRAAVRLSETPGAIVTRAADARRAHRSGAGRTRL